MDKSVEELVRSAQNLLNVNENGRSPHFINMEIRKVLSKLSRSKEVSKFVRSEARDTRNFIHEWELMDEDRVWMVNWLFDGILEGYL